MDLNIWVFPVAALIPLIVGSIWYNPNILGKAWMKQSGITEEQIQRGNMIVTFGLTYLLSLFLTAMITPLVIHQSGMLSLVATNPEFADTGSEIYAYYADFQSRFGDTHRTFGHGSFHGVFAGLLFALPVIGIISLFEKRSFKYIAIHAGYWVITIGLMGGLIGQFA